jgi:putative oxidoreductase
MPMEAHTPAPLKVLHHPDLGLLLIRIGIAAVGVFHGGQKIFGWWGGGSVAKFAENLTGMNVPMPTASAWMAALSEFAGGILIGLGLFSRVAAFFLGFTMLVAWGMAHKFTFVKPAGNDFPFLIMMVAAGLILTGPGKFSINALIFGPKPKAA